MLDTAAVEEQTEQIRRQVRELSDEQRKTYYARTSDKIKDPDTYATLNYIFVAGLHHFYIGKWGLGLINIAVFWGGVAMIAVGMVEIGIALIIGIAIFELYELFRSQAIINDYNNQISAQIIQDIVNNQ